MVIFTQYFVSCDVHLIQPLLQRVLLRGSLQVVVVQVIDILRVVVGVQDLT